MGDSDERIPKGNSVELAHGFLYTNDWGMLKLEDLIDELPAEYQGPISAEKINDYGEICGEADGQPILLTPVSP